MNIFDWFGIGKTLAILWALLWVLTGEFAHNRIHIVAPVQTTPAAAQDSPCSAQDVIRAISDGRNELNAAGAKFQRQIDEIKRETGHPFGEGYDN